jgi:hypothetical protein
MIECTLLERLAIRPSRSGRFLERIATGRPFFPQADTGKDPVFRYPELILTRQLGRFFTGSRRKRLSCTWTIGNGAVSMSYWAC